ncbi:helicase SKI2W-like isoform X2 [Pollicipes pollicipes]|nr:helicase SKI2W-like isoform X2 [Pollicipes pollicipes]
MPTEPPPTFSALEERIDHYLLHPDNLPIHDYRYCQEYVEPATDFTELLAVERSPVSTTLQVDRDPTTGEIRAFTEVPVDPAELGRTARNSFSLRRAPGPAEQDVRGDVANFPFWPGGMAPPPPAEPELEELDPSEYLTLAPGLSDGLRLELAEPDWAPATDPTAGEPLVPELGYDWVWQRDSAAEEPSLEPPQSGPSPADQQQQTELEAALTPAVVPVLGTTEAARPGRRLRSTKWAEEVDISRPIDDFHRLVPNMAHKFPYELDTFQKQAVLHLERAESVFVAAHTSAGKTTVAEYAIAMSRRNGTKTVYTSPIKALSNQKFRDFKTTFNDVGLLTGDIQINKEASCLICTTEILRSMLYNGSDLIRDLEWVIFDEVHYINDPERGVVWEESLILLPDTVGIVLLSATVPNALEFADWIGHIKKRKLRVISTAKRPVPLEHFLYTGQGGKSRDDRFLVLDSRGQFITPGYLQAMEAKKGAIKKGGTSARDSRGARGAGGGGRGGHGGHGGHGGGHGGGPQQERNTWIGLVEHLRRRELLPVVAFTFSRARCDSNAASLTSLALTTEREKNEIRYFFNRCLQRLTAPDQKLPQVTQMSELLARGVGVHHSGILPILKEVIEMLFQRGLVKLLFATETFAMGVNMPARTVIFDSIRKHDGKGFRTLLPGEYIQMAGRAGRRGLDPTGTVIIMCKHEVPESSELQGMMLGKPTQLVSQFHLTYSMILNLLRIQQLRIEDIMKSSFAEVDGQKTRAENEQRLSRLQASVEQQRPSVDRSCADIDPFFTACRDYLQMRDGVRERLYATNAGVKALESVGQLVVFSTDTLSRRIGVVLQFQRSAGHTFSVLACEGGVRPDDTSPVAWRMRQAVSDQLLEPVGPATYGLHTVTRADVDQLLTKTVKVEASKVVDDIKRRQLPRFADNPPSESCARAIRELAAAAGVAARQLHVNQIELADDLASLERLRQRLLEFECIQSPLFPETLEAVSAYRAVQDEIADLQFRLSDASLRLRPEYQLRVNVLRHLSYVDKNNVVKMKGRVGCEMGYRELLVTELVFHDVLTRREPAEIAALLSALVFEQKRCSEPQLLPALEKGKEELISVAREIDHCQNECHLGDAEKHEEMLNFGLVEVVFEWARGMTFNNIVQLTDVQEGIIVRCIQRLDETLRDVRNAARTIGNPTLYEKASQASTDIKRDIVFAASLYTQT